MNKLEKIRELMKRENIDIYIIFTDDFHSSEYVGDYFKCREYMSGFTGSAGRLVITKDMAGLWTDGRYFIQAGEQLKNSEIQLFKMGENGVDTIEEFLIKNLKDGDCLGFDGRTVLAKFILNLQEKLKNKNLKYVYQIDLVDEIWVDRPKISQEKAFILDEKYSGESTKNKLEEVRFVMNRKKADMLLITSLDDIAWLLNIRGNDIKYNPVLLSYIILTREDVLFFTNEQAFTSEDKEKLKLNNIKFFEYNYVYEYIKEINNVSLMLDTGKVNYTIIKNINNNVNIIDEANPTLILKAIKNKIEIKNMIIAHIKDGVCVTKFIYWLKKNIGKVKITELSASKYLENLRSKQENYIEQSFEPIVSYAEHSAIVHYSATEKTNIEILPENFLLVDTGAQYLEGTTDITRTISLGKLDFDQKVNYTAVLKGNLNLANIKFRYGCKGANLDCVARKSLWELGLDYNHSTGHGVGYLLNVHEGPNSFRMNISKDDIVFEEGMITSDEPGVYLEGKYGIRLENLILCKKAEKTEYGQFMKFECLTLAPFDLDAVLPEIMSEKEKKFLNDYHKRVYDEISPYLLDEEKIWLKEATREI